MVTCVTVLTMVTMVTIIAMVTNLTPSVFSDNSLDIGAVVKSVSARVPILLMYKVETENAKFLVAELALKKAVCY